MKSGTTLGQFFRRFQPEVPAAPAPPAPPSSAGKDGPAAARIPSVRSVAKLGFTLTGFTDDTGFRVFAFQRAGDKGARVDYTVKANLDLSRTYGILLQELPLLCRGLLDLLPEGTEARVLTLTEERMRSHRDDRAAERLAARHRRPPRRAGAEPDASE